MRITHTAEKTVHWRFSDRSFGSHVSTEPSENGWRNPTLGPVYATPIISGEDKQTVRDTGYDRMEPFISKAQEKMHVCLHNRLTTRAAFRTSGNLFTAAFLSCRFIHSISRRGALKILRGDCGTNFNNGERMEDAIFEKKRQFRLIPDDLLRTGENQMDLQSCSISVDGWVWKRLVGLVKKALNK